MTTEQITTACIVGGDIYHRLDEKYIPGEKIKSPHTPFGDSGDIYIVQRDGRRFYLLARYGAGEGPAACEHDCRANIYALRELGVKTVLGWTPARAATRNLSVGDLVIPSDLIDFTTRGGGSFFERSALGCLREFPVFCTNLRPAAQDVMENLKLPCRPGGVVAVTDGPRMATSAEVRMFTTCGASMLTHAIAPEVFLACELQMCYAAVCYVSGYAETGSTHKPFHSTGLFGREMDDPAAKWRQVVCDDMLDVVAGVFKEAQATEKNCSCGRAMEEMKNTFNLPDDWREWFDPAGHK